MRFAFASTVAVLAVLAVVTGCAPSTTRGGRDDARAPEGPLPLHEKDGVAQADVDVAASAHDADQDGIDDDVEDAIARAYLPYLSTHTHDDCPLSGLVFRVHPHVDDARFVSVIYSRLYEKDCGVVAGLGGHVGDDEAFGITVDPAVDAPAGIVSMVAVSHQGTTCERDTSCGVCPGLDACDTADVGGARFPVVYASKDKHASAVNLAHGCSLFGSCFDRCELAPSPTSDLPMVNVGEPDHPRVHDLTTQGFITTANGWTEPSLMHYDPWSAAQFGTAGVVSGDMVDPAFTAAACPAPTSATP